MYDTGNDGPGRALKRIHIIYIGEKFRVVYSG